MLGWMFNVLNLNGNNALVFGLIYGFSQDGESKFNGSLTYISDSLNISRNTAIKCLKFLEKKGYVIKEQTNVGGVTYNQYYTCSAETALGSAETDKGSAETDILGSAETAPNNTIINNTSDSDISALDFLKKYHPTDYEDLLMKFKKQIKDWPRFELKFNAVFDKDDLDFKSRIIRGRFIGFATEWITKQHKDNDGVIQLKGPQFKRIG